MKKLLTAEEMLQALYKCNQCGACASVCPLYRHTTDESMCARGKLALIDAVFSGRLLPGKKYAERLHTCLLCRACSDNCAGGIPTTEIFLFARQMLAESGISPRSGRILLNRFITGPGRFSNLIRAINLYGLLREQRLFKNTGLWRLLPEYRRFSAMRLFSARIGRPLPVAGGLETPGSRGTVAYFTGCALAGFFPDVVRATGRVLSHNGWKAVSLNNGCCGMPHLAYGYVEAARRLARKNIDLFIDQEVIITDCATCGSALKSYASLLAGDSAYAGKAAAFSAKVRDISEFLMETGFLRPRSAPFKKQTPVTYHDPCHLARSQGIRQQPRTVLKAVPGVVLKELEGPETCCGGSGLFALKHPDLSIKVGSDKINTILSTGANIVTSGCPGCIMQIEAALQMENRGNIRVAHPVELLAASYDAGRETSNKLKTD